jgi:hypothetical protein
MTPFLTEMNHFSPAMPRFSTAVAYFPPAMPRFLSETVHGCAENIIRFLKTIHSLILYIYENTKKANSL